MKADTYTPSTLWDNGNVDGNWDLDSGWTSGQEPDETDLVAINNGRIVTITQPGEVADVLRLASTPTSRGTLRVLSGDLMFRLGRVGDEGIGVVNQLGGSVTSTNQLWIGARGPGYDAAGQGTYNLTGGSLTVLGTSNTAFRIGRAGGTGVLNHSGGILSTADQLNIAAIPAADGHPSRGSYIISGNAVLNVGSTLLNDATGDDPGEALFEIRGSQVSISMLSYGHRPDGTLRFVADAFGVSPIHVLNAPVGVEIEDGLLDIDLTALAGTPQSLVLIDNQTANPIKGQGGIGIGRFVNAPEGTLFGDYRLTYFYDSGDGVGNDLALLYEGLAGDFDGNSLVNADDIDLLADAIRSGSNDLQFDLNSDLQLSSLDLDYMIQEILNTLLGDTNLDQAVDLVDLSILASSFGGTSGWAGGNFNTDTLVDLIDLSTLAANFGQSPAVPEPGSALVMLWLAFGTRSGYRTFSS
ncbi:MAG: hypothetical protein RLN76_00460 [Phycisphaeraceae bacterium]